MRMVNSLVDSPGCVSIAGRPAPRRFPPCLYTGFGSDTAQIVAAVESGGKLLVDSIISGGIIKSEAKVGLTTGQPAQQLKSAIPPRMVCFSLTNAPLRGFAFLRTMSTSKLQRYVSKQLSKHLGAYTVRENTRPDWLITKDGARLELDFIIEELDAAIEVQGVQHYVFTPHFHGSYDDFKRREGFDAFKRKVCIHRGIRLFEVSNNEEADDCLRFLVAASRGKAVKPDSVFQRPRQRITKGRISKLAATVMTYKESNPVLAERAMRELQEAESSYPHFGQMIQARLKKLFK